MIKIRSERTIICPKVGTGKRESNEFTYLMISRKKNEMKKEKRNEMNEILMGIALHTTDRVGQNIRNMIDQNVVLSSHIERSKLLC